jgi:hypothetical protein
MKRQNEAFGSRTTTGSYGPADVNDFSLNDFPSQELVPEGPLMSAFDVLQRKDLLSLLAQRITQLPLWSQKILAMYYYENLPISRIANCFDLPACRVNEILMQTVGSLRGGILGASKIE